MVHLQPVLLELILPGSGLGLISFQTFCFLLQDSQDIPGFQEQNRLLFKFVLVPWRPKKPVSVLFVMVIPADTQGGAADSGQ